MSARPFLLVRSCPFLLVRHRPQCPACPDMPHYCTSSPLSGRPPTRQLARLPAQLPTCRRCLSPTLCFAHTSS